MTWRLATYATVLQSSFQPALWPAYTEAYAKGSYDWVRRTFWLTMRTSMTIAALCLGCLAVFGRTAIHWYIGPAAVPAWPLLIAICSWNLVSTLMETEACLLAAVDRVKLQSILSLVAAGINLVVSIQLAKRIGPIGVVLGTAFSYAVALVVPQSIEVYKVLYHPPERTLLETEITKAPHSAEESIAS